MFMVTRPINLIFSVKLPAALLGPVFVSLRDLYFDTFILTAKAVFSYAFAYYFPGLLTHYTV